MQPEQLLPDLTADTKEGVIEELLGVLAKCGKITDVAGIRDEVMAREKQMSTGMEHGIAIPHARTNAVDQLVCAIGIHRSGVDYDALDGKPSRIFVLTLTPADAGSLHIKFMAMISRLLNDVGREKVLNANGRDELWKVLTG
jgi:PTS system nitrogen regulatory IIA component